MILKYVREGTIAVYEGKALSTEPILYRCNQYKQLGGTSVFTLYSKGKGRGIRYSCAWQRCSTLSHWHEPVVGND